MKSSAAPKKKKNGRSDNLNHFKKSKQGKICCCLANIKTNRRSEWKSFCLPDGNSKILQPG